MRKITIFLIFLHANVHELATNHDLMKLVARAKELLLAHRQCNLICKNLSSGQNESRSGDALKLKLHSERSHMLNFIIFAAFILVLAIKISCA
jgi:hypothetical protein